MKRRIARPEPTRELELTTATRRCPGCGGPLWAAYKNRRVVVTLDGVVRLAVQVRRCRNPDCPRSGVPLRPEPEGRIALPGSEFGLDVIALVGRLRHAEHRSVPEIHAELVRRGVPICARSVSVSSWRSSRLLRMADRRVSSSASCSRRSRMPVMATSSREPVASLR